MVLESGKYLTFFSLRLLSEIKPTILAKQNKQWPCLPMGLAKRHSYFTSCSSSVPDVCFSPFQILANQTDVTFQNMVFAPLAYQPSCLVQTSLGRFELPSLYCAMSEMSNLSWMQTQAFSSQCVDEDARYVRAEQRCKWGLAVAVGQRIVLFKMSNSWFGREMELSNVSTLEI